MYTHTRTRVCVGTTLYDAVAFKEVECRYLGHIDKLEKQVAFSLGSTMEHAPAHGRRRGDKSLGCYIGHDDWVRQQLCAKVMQKLAPLGRIDVMRDVDDVTVMCGTGARTTQRVRRLGGGL